MFFSGVSFMRGMGFMNRVRLSGGGLMKGVGLVESWAMSFMRGMGFMGYLHYK